MCRYSFAHFRFITFVRFSYQVKIPVLTDCYGIQTRIYTHLLLIRDLPNFIMKPDCYNANCIIAATVLQVGRKIKIRWKPKWSNVCCNLHIVLSSSAPTCLQSHLGKNAYTTYILDAGSFLHKHMLIPHFTWYSICLYHFWTFIR